MTRWPTQTQPSSRRKAKAPYNFVRLPEMIPWTPQDPPAMDRYHEHDERYTGHLTCTLTTASPLYVRCGVTPAEAKAGSEAKDRPDFFYTDPHTRNPVIPGSSLRGMLRTLVEIVSYSKVQPVTDESLVYRAVAGRSSLGDQYRDLMTYRTSSHAIAFQMQAGYMLQQEGDWYIVPAEKIYGEPFARIEMQDIPRGLTQWEKSRNAWEIYVDIDQPREHRHNRGRIRLYYPKVKRGKAASSSQPRFSRRVLVRTGRIPRKHMEFIFGLPTRGPLIPVSERLIETYRNQITDEQIKLLGKRRVLKNVQPVFYLMDGRKLLFFGHAMMFRLPYPNTPRDCVPDVLHNPEQTDLVEALFGYVDENAKERAVARAGRVAVTDATLLDDPDDIWLTDKGLIPKILATPKPTTFQHYLVQPASQESLLRHYGSPTPDETVIRGHKLYWHKGDVNRAAIEAEDAELRGRAQLPPDDTQHTVIQPVRSGVHFQFDIHFENVAAEELGALLWLLEIAQDDDYRLKLGMAKPLGMGAIRVESDLHLTDRTARYTQLFTDDGDAWATGERDDAQTIWEDAVAAFETWLLKHNAEASINPHKKDTVAELTRIEMLLALLRWPGPAREETRYLQIEHPQNNNEYRNRPVLPTPLQVMEESAPAPPRAASQSQEKRHTGTVKWFNDQKGFGFIKVDGQSNEVFVHYSDIEGSGRRSLQENERVSFIITPNPPKGPKAQQVRKL